MSHNGNLQKRLECLRLEELKILVKDFELKDVKISQPKDSLIAEICSSDVLNKNAVLLARLNRISEYFFSGGRQSLTLFELAVCLDELGERSFYDIFNRNGEIKHGKEVFRFKSFFMMEFQGEKFPVVEYDYPGQNREIVDYNHGPMVYTPIARAVCILRKNGKKTIFDVRCSTAKSSDFANCLSAAIFGIADNGSLNIPPKKVVLAHNLSMKLREKFNARSFQVKITESDEIDGVGRLHPSSTEFLSKLHDLTDSRDCLMISDAAEDQAHGLEFDDSFEGITVKNGCKLCLNYPTGQVIFKKTASFGAYDKVIKSILEIKNGMD